jgi:ribosomal protein S15P/S13E
MCEGKRVRLEYDQANAVSGIQHACAALLVARMNELARRFRENKSEIANLRWQLSIVRKPVLR